MTTRDPVTEAELIVELEANRAKLEQLRAEMRTFADSIRLPHQTDTPD